MATRSTTQTHLTWHADEIEHMQYAGIASKRTMLDDTSNHVYNAKEQCGAPRTRILFGHADVRQTSLLFHDHANRRSVWMGLNHRTGTGPSTD